MKTLYPRAVGAVVVIASAVAAVSLAGTGVVSHDSRAQRITAAGTFSDLSERATSALETKYVPGTGINGSNGGGCVTGLPDSRRLGSCYVIG
jgi:hypothetical protein